MPIGCCMTQVEETKQFTVMDQSQEAMDEMKSKIIKFSLDNCELGNQGFNRVLLQLFGFIGHGKSSLINSCKYVLKDEAYTTYAQVENTRGACTMSRKAYPLTSTMTIVDNRGCCSMNGFETEEIYAQLGNFLPLNTVLEWAIGFEQTMNRLENSEMDPNFTDFIVPIFVYSVTETITDHKEEIKHFLKNCKAMTGVFPIIVLTHITCGDFYEVEKVFRLMGAEQVMKMENYTAEDHVRSRGRHSETLKFLNNVLEDVKFRMRESINPKKERIERKKFLLNFIHDREVAKKMEEIEINRIAKEKEIAKNQRPSLLSWFWYRK